MELGVSNVCDCEASIMNRPWPTRGSCSMRGGGKDGVWCAVIFLLCLNPKRNI